MLLQFNKKLLDFDYGSDEEEGIDLLAFMKATMKQEESA